MKSLKPFAERSYRLVPDGYHAFTIEDCVYEVIRNNYPEVTPIEGLMADHGLSIKSDLTVYKSGGSISVCSPGAWMYNGTPVLMFGYRPDGTPKIIPIDQATLTQVPDTRKYYLTLDGVDYDMLVAPAFVGEKYPRSIKGADLGGLVKDLSSGYKKYPHLKDLMRGKEELTLEVTDCYEVEDKFPKKILNTNLGEIAVPAGLYDKVRVVMLLRLAQGDGSREVTIIPDGEYKGYTVYSIK